MGRSFLERELSWRNYDWREGFVVGDRGVDGGFMREVLEERRKRGEIAGLGFCLVIFLFCVFRGLFRGRFSEIRKGF